MQQLSDPSLAGLMVEAALDAMVCVDASGRIVLVNAQTERLFGYPREDVVGQPVEILVPDAANARHPLRAGYAGNTRPTGSGLELSGRRRDGTTFPAEISLSTIGAGRGPPGISRHPRRHRPARGGDGPAAAGIDRGRLPP